MKILFKNKLNWLKTVLLLLLVAVQFYMGLIPGWQKIQSDFPNYYSSAKLIADGKDISRIYDDSWFNEVLKSYGIEEEGKFSPCPPPTALLLLELTPFEPLAAKRIWMVVNIILFFFCAQVIQKITSWKYSYCAGIILLCGLGLANNFRLGQMYLFLLLLIMLGYYLAQQNKSYTGGLLWGAGIAVKYFPVILLPAYFKDKKIIFGSIASFLFLNTVAFYFFGAKIYSEFFGKVFLPHLDGHLSSQSPWSTAFQSWNSLFSNLFLYDAVENPAPLVNFPFMFFIAKYTVLLLIVSVSTFTFLKLKNHPHAKDIALILLTTTSLALLPASATYQYLLLVFPLVLMLRLTEKRKQIILTLLFLFSVIGFVPFVLHFLPGSVREILFVAFHRLWLVTLFYAAVIIILLRQIRTEKN